MLKRMPEDKINITTEELPQGIVSIAIKGYVVTVNCSILTQTLDNLFAQRQYKIVVDMSGVEYLGSTGAGILIGALAKAQENQGKLVLVQPQPRVMEVFNLLGLDQILTIANNIDTALKAFI